MKFKTIHLMLAIAACGLILSAYRYTDRWFFCLGQAVHCHNLSVVARTSAGITMDLLDQENLKYAGKKISEDQVKKQLSLAEADSIDAEIWERRCGKFEKAMWFPWLQVPSESSSR